ncbi:unnamed protein product [Lampetra planeri]
MGRAVSSEWLCASCQTARHEARPPHGYGRLGAQGVGGGVQEEVVVVVEAAAAAQEQGGWQTRERHGTADLASNHGLSHQSHRLTNHDDQEAVASHHYHHQRQQHQQHHQHQQHPPALTPHLRHEESWQNHGGARFIGREREEVVAQGETQIPRSDSLYFSLRGERAAVDDHHHHQQQQQQQRQPTTCFIPMDGGHSCRHSSPPAVARGRDRLESLARPELPQPYFSATQTSDPPLCMPCRTTHDDKPAAGVAAAAPDVPPPRPHEPAGDTTPETPVATGPVARRPMPPCGAGEGAVARAGRPPGVAPPRYTDQSVSDTITGRSPAMVFPQGRPPVGLSRPSQIADHHQHHHQHNHLLLGHHVEVTISQPSRFPPRGQVTTACSGGSAGHVARDHSRQLGFARGAGSSTVVMDGSRAAESPAAWPNVRMPTPLPDGPSEPPGLESPPWRPCPDPESGAASWTLDLAERHRSASASGANSAHAGGRDPCTASERSTERSTERSYAARVCSVMVERSDSPLSLVTAASHSRLAHAAAAAAVATAEEEGEEKRRSTCETVIISIDPELLTLGTSEASQPQQQLDDDAVNYTMPKAAAVAASAAAAAATTAASVAEAGVPETVARRDKSEGAVNLSTGEGRRRASPALSSSSSTGGGMDLRAVATTRPARPPGSAPDDASGKPSREPLGIAADPAIVNLTTGPSSLAGPCGDDGRHRPAVPHLTALNLARESTRIFRSDLGDQAAAAAAATAAATAAGARVPPLGALVDLSRPRPCQAVPAVRRDRRRAAEASARPVDLTAAKAPGGRSGLGPREAVPCVVIAAEALGPPLWPCCWRSAGDRPWAPYAPAAAPADVKAVDLTAGRWLAGGRCSAWATCCPISARPASRRAASAPVAAVLPIHGPPRRPHNIDRPSVRPQNIGRPSVRPPLQPRVAPMISCGVST